MLIFLVPTKCFEHMSSQYFFSTAWPSPFQAKADRSFQVQWLSLQWMTYTHTHNWPTTCFLSIYDYSLETKTYCTDNIFFHAAQYWFNTSGCSEAILFLEERASIKNSLQGMRVVFAGRGALHVIFQREASPMIRQHKNRQVKIIQNA